MDVKRIRQAAGVTQKEFCKKYSIPLKTLQNWEADETVSSHRDCPVYLLKLLEKAVKIDFPGSRGLLNAKIDEIHFDEILKARKKIIKSPLFKYTNDVILYGSTARSQAKRTSDIDILIVLDENIKKNGNYNDWIIYLKGNISSDDFNTPETDLHVVFGSNWKNTNDAYFVNIIEEGFSIWN